MSDELTQEMIDARPAPCVGMRCCLAGSGIWGSVKHVEGKCVGFDFDDAGHCAVPSTRSSLWRPPFTERQRSGDDQ